LTKDKEAGPNGAVAQDVFTTSARYPFSNDSKYFNKMFLLFKLFQWVASS